MLLVLLCAVFLLAVIPAALLWLGRMIEANTDGRGRIMAMQAKIKAAQGTHDPDRTPWFRRPMQPAFKKPLQPS